jgi:hypothetical protein
VSKEGLDALRARVGEDAELARRLRRIEPAHFVDEARAIAAELGFDVKTADLDAAIAQGRQAWALRWIL